MIDLQTHFFTPRGVLKAVNGVSFSVGRGEILAVVGESGCGKSVTAFSILQLVAQPPGRIVGGQVLFEGRDLLHCDAEQMREVRGNQIAMIFQEPMTSLNPVLTIGEQVAETLIRHRGMTPKAARERVLELLSLVRMSAPRQRLDQYPHELSGGMRQRVMIAMALACEPKLLIADEPTTALDVTVQAQILDLLLEMRDRLGMGIVLITHDLGVVAETADRVAVMYAGRKVEEASVFDLFAAPCHPYTQGLIRSTPGTGSGRPARLHEIAGMVPALDQMPAGCSFAARCQLASDTCRAATPPLRVTGLQRSVACIHALVPESKHVETV
ncbi:MAG: ABC transporter ATP-binding protein [Aquabacterium sp.]|nr:ABC transporter ATP-binding protein [Aquabacterium sp.]